MLFSKTHYFSFFEESITDILKGKIIIDLGTDIPFRKESKRFQKLLKGHYYTLDYLFGHSSYFPDVYGDAQYLPFKSESIDGIICKDVIEHIQHPEKVVNEVYRCLKQKGKAFFTLPFFIPYHGSKDEYEDFFRFTIGGITYLFRNFKKIEINNAGGLLFVIAPYLPKWIYRLIYFSPLIYLINIIDKKIRTTNLTPLYMVLVIK